MPSTALQMHTTLMSVSFGVGIAYLVHSSRALHNFRDYTIWFSSLVVTVCIWWWYAHMGAIFPSDQLHDYFLDMSIAVGLCVMCGNVQRLNFWLFGWVSMVVFATIKLIIVLCITFKVDDPAIISLRPAIVFGLGGTTSIFLVVIGMAISAVQFKTQFNFKRAIQWGWLLIPIFLGVLATFIVAYWHLIDE